MKNLFQSHSNFDSLADMVSKAVDSTKPTLTKSLPKNRVKMDEAFQDLNHNYQLYKREEIDKSSLEEFNSNDEEGNPVNEFADDWFSKVKEKYYDLVESSDEILEGDKSSEQKVPSPSDDLKPTEMKVNQGRRKALVEKQLDGMKTSIKKATDNLKNAVESTSGETISPSHCVGFQKTASDILARCNDSLQRQAQEYLEMLDEEEVEKFQDEFVKFVTDNTETIDEIQLSVIQKTKDFTINPMERHPRTSSGSGNVMLKKIEPPKFTGSIVDYPDFQRRWKASVGMAKFGQEAELDRLRDNIPKDATKMLIGETTMKGAWKTLDTMYGNKTMLANKLKSNLKSLKIAGKEDYEIVISLAIEVKSIVARLRELKLEDTLKHDDEYLAAIFKILPNQERVEWLNEDKTKFDCNWSAMLNFLEKAHRKSTDTKVLLSSYAAQNTDKVKSTTVDKIDKSERKLKVAQAKLKQLANKSKLDKSGDVESKKDLELDRKKDKDFCGKCPICDIYHTFNR